MATSLKVEMFQEVYSKIAQGTERWNQLPVKESLNFEWKHDSTYIHNPPFFGKTELVASEVKDIKDAFCLVYLGDSITTDHISPAGNISKNSPAARYLLERKIQLKDFNTYGSRRGNDEIMARGTFANSSIKNHLVEVQGPKTLHLPTNQVLDIFDASDLYQKKGDQLIVLAGQEYGSGSSRDWAAKFIFAIYSKGAHAFGRQIGHCAEL